MKTLEQLTAELETAREQVFVIEQQIRKIEDGFIYVTKTRCWGSITWRSHTNAFCANEEVKEYYGDNGIVDLYTNNPNHNIDNYSGDTHVMSEEEILNMAKENISMSRAICNWIARS